MGAGVAEGRCRLLQHRPQERLQQAHELSMNIDITIRKFMCICSQGVAFPQSAPDWFAEGRSHQRRTVLLVERHLCMCWAYGLRRLSHVLGLGQRVNHPMAVLTRCTAGGSHSRTSLHISATTQRTLMLRRTGLLANRPADIGQVGVRGAYVFFLLSVG